MSQLSDMEDNIPPPHHITNSITTTYHNFVLRLGMCVALSPLPYMTISYHVTTWRHNLED